MKDFLIAVVGTFVLSLVLSVFYTSDLYPAQNGFGTQYPGESGVVLPGGGALPAQVIPEASDEEPQTETGPAREEIPAATDQTTTCEECEEYEGKEADSNMGELLISFWHGVAAVLIGETCALAMAAVWLRMKMAQLKKRKEMNQ